MEEKTGIRINLNTREFEINGSEEFISKYDNVIQSFLKIIESDNLSTVKNPENKKQSPKKTQGTEHVKDSSNEADSHAVPVSFGEYYHKLPSSAKSVDKILLAGYFVQQGSESSSFATKEASSLLLEQGVKLSNPSEFMRANLATKKVFKHQGKYRVSETGIAFLERITTTA
ncbi:MAG: hypothetical protein QNK23_07210 [Crocinitomicaceae bacterium]|nr:hypothetical protein [Crocinitomicaceae bacterium]